MGITSPYPRENIIAGDYILADTQVFLSKRHRQQNKEILIKHSPGIGECFLFSNIQLTEKIKKFHQEPVFMPFIFCISVRTFFSQHKNDFYNN